SRRRHTRWPRDWSSDVCSSDLEVVDAAHHLDSERHRAVLALEALAELGELLADRRDRVRTLTAEQEARMEDHQLGARGLRDPGEIGRASCRERGEVWERGGAER